ncbi:hypothetical protein [Halodesulfovibrio marinisediminis]|uniref:Uncharacterized protein n=1 Tax=Halodesulfovibrio marinisediminis DSM 17456 TaxID=1121457 RepID=A0A1N6I781_9BACT|nr:hypothetical protein [Halodesulfovibrio marinisediminis]SIO27877.1 hypothetical protein SAMN02745161_2476 [Halodesulfovibrio marinisediminis DSM 17456]
MDISTFDKEVKAALETLPEEPVAYVKAVVSTAQNFTDFYFVDITWNDGLNETTTQLKVNREVSSEEVQEKIKAAYDYASLQALL